MSTKIDKKTIMIVAGIIICLCLAIFFGFHILMPALDPVAMDMIKLFCSGAGCGLLAGIWIGRRIERKFGVKNSEGTAH